MGEDEEEGGVEVRQGLRDEGVWHVYCEDGKAVGQRREDEGHQMLFCLKGAPQQVFEDFWDSNSFF